MAIDRHLMIAQMEQFIAQNRMGREWYDEHIAAHLQELLDDSALQEYLVRILWKKGLPAWHGSLSTRYQLSTGSRVYQVAGIDGSQIEADYHSGFDCHVTHVSSALFRYGEFQSTLSYYTSQRIHQVDRTPLDRLRMVEEYGMVDLVWNRSNPDLIMLDGPLIGSHSTESLDLGSHAYYDLWRSNHCTIVGYLSAPRMTMLAQALALLCAERCRKQIETIPLITDGILMEQVLPVGHYGVFWSAQDKPSIYSVYIRTTREVARIDIPDYCVATAADREMILQRIADQIEKGRGYPICLAEAHMHAIIRESDRQYSMEAYRTINSLQQRNRPIYRSAKLTRKRAIPI